ncbi:MAG: O-antigen ligase family protein [Candidatus Moraniibacteriota bacterium]
MWKALKKIIEVRPDLLFFYVFLWMFPFSWRKVLSASPPLGFTGFNEYTDMSLYIGDIFLALAVLLYILEHRKYIMSIYRERVFHVEHSLFLLLPSLLVILAFLSIFWSSQKSIAFYSSLKLSEMVALYYYILLNIVPRGTNKQSSTWNFVSGSLWIIVVSGIFQSGIVFFQFIFQSSLAIHFLGESIISPYLPGIAKIIVFSDPYIRAYGTFPHPNVLGGFLVFSLFSLVYLYREKMFHVEQKIFYPFLFILFIGITLTFSKSAFISFIISLSILWYRKNKDSETVPRGTVRDRFRNMFHVEQLLFLCAIAILLLISLLQNERNLWQSVNERLSLLPFTLEYIAWHPFLGNGVGQFVYNISLDGNFLPWQFQPIHNIYLLLIYELGLFGLSLLGIFLFFLLHIVPRGTWANYSFTLVISLLVIGFMDHYLWDIQTGQIMLWTALAFLSSSKILTK